MPYLTDTNLLLRTAQPTHPLFTRATLALQTLRRQGEQACIVPQNLVEFWAVATRPVERNGLGMGAVRAEKELARLEAFFPILPDDPGIYTEWRRLVTTHGITGLRVHDARLAAAMVVHGITHLVTFNPTTSAITRRRSPW